MEGAQGGRKQPVCCSRAPARTSPATDLVVFTIREMLFFSWKTPGEQRLSTSQVGRLDAFVIALAPGVGV